MIEHQGFAALPRLDAEIAAAQRRLLALTPVQPQGALSGISFAWEPVGAADAALQLALRIAGEAFEVAVQGPEALPALAAMLQRGLPAALRTAGLAYMVQPTLDSISLLLKARVELTATATEAVAPPEAGIGFLVEPAGGIPWRGWIRPAHLQGWAWLVRAAETLMPRRTPSAVPVDCHPVLGSTRVSANDLRGLAAGDVLVIQRGVGTRDELQCWLALGDNRRVVGRAAVCVGGLQVIGIGGQEEASMDYEPAPDAAHPTLASAGEVEVTVRFELKPWRANLDELGLLAPGSVIDTGGHIGDAEIALWVERRCIGTGRLMAVGDRLGVRVHQLWAPRGGPGDEGGEGGSA